VLRAALEQLALAPPLQRALLEGVMLHHELWIYAPMATQLALIDHVMLPYVRGRGWQQRLLMARRGVAGMLDVLLLFYWEKEHAESVAVGVLLDQRGTRRTLSTRPDVAELRLVRARVYALIAAMLALHAAKRDELVQDCRALLDYALRCLALDGNSLLALELITFLTDLLQPSPSSSLSTPPDLAPALFEALQSLGGLAPLYALLLRVSTEAELDEVKAALLRMMAMVARLIELTPGQFTLFTAKRSLADVLDHFQPLGAILLDRSAYSPTIHQALWALLVTTQDAASPSTSTSAPATPATPSSTSSTTSSTPSIASPSPSTVERIIQPSLLAVLLRVAHAKADSALYASILTQVAALLSVPGNSSIVLPFMLNVIDSLVPIERSQLAIASEMLVQLIAEAMQSSAGPEVIDLVCSAFAYKCPTANEPASSAASVLASIFTVHLCVCSKSS